MILSQNVLNNRLKGNLGVASGWGTAPTNLERCTDSNLEIATGTGSTVMLAGGVIGEIVFDLGSIKTILVSVRVGLWSSTGTIQLHLLSSDNAVTWRYAGGDDEVILGTSVTEIIGDSLAQILTGRYLKAQFKANVAMTGYIKIYEVMGWELRV